MDRSIIKKSISVCWKVSKFRTKVQDSDEELPVGRPFLRVSYTLDGPVRRYRRYSKLRSAQEFTGDQLRHAASEIKEKYPFSCTVIAFPVPSEVADLFDPDAWIYVGGYATFKRKEDARMCSVALLENHIQYCTACEYMMSINQLYTDKATYG